jgi:nicotinate-nucleotide adenylyltransferase
MSKLKFLNFRDSNIKIGILGGSFNPPHIGHVHISLQTMKRFGLSYVFWLLTPCNPTKNPATYISLPERFKKCLEITKHYQNKIKILDIEKFFRNNYSANTVDFIKTIHPNTEIYWIMGCDNILHFHKWYKWRNIINKTKIVVCERSEMGIKFHNTKASNNYGFSVVNIKHEEGNLMMFHMKKINISSTNLRNMLFLST